MRAKYTLFKRDGSSETIPVGDRKVWKYIYIYIFYLNLPHQIRIYLVKLMMRSHVVYSQPRKIDFYFNWITISQPNT